MYDYKATVVRWHDGDTVLLDIDQGFGNSIRAWVRLVDCWAPEMNAGGDLALGFARGLAPEGSECFVITRKLDDDKPWFQGKQLGQTFARWLGTVFPARADVGSVNRLMVQAGYATRART